MKASTTKGPGGLLCRLRREERGVAMVSVGLLGAFLVLISVVVAIRTMNTTTSVDQDRSFEQAIHVAESGADQALYRLDVGEDLAEVTLSTDPTKAEVVAAAEKLAANDPDEVAVTPDGEVVVIKDAATETAFAVGFSPGIDAANRSARVVVVDYYFHRGYPIVYPDGAVIANGDVRFTGNGNTRTNPASEHSADIHTNGNFTGNGVTFIDGEVGAVGTAGGGTAYGDMTSGAEPVAFPTQEEIDLWELDLIAEAQTGPTLASLPSELDGSAYIAGDVSINCNCTITLNGPGTVYVDGSIFIGARTRIVNNAVTLATADNFWMSGDSTYSVTGDLDTSALIVFGDHAQALQMSGQGTAATQGFVYVPNGGATIVGEAAVVGSLVVKGDVDLKGNGGIVYPDGLNGKTNVTPPVNPFPQVETINELNVNEL